MTDGWVMLLYIVVCDLDMSRFDQIRTCLDCTINKLRFEPL